MRISLGTDHGGYLLKDGIKKFLLSIGIEFVDFGPDSDDACDYPDFGFAAAEALSKSEVDFAIIICKSGIGMSIVGNKVKGVRAALCLTEEDAKSARQHNHANALALSANRTSIETAIRIIDTFVNTEPELGRHLRRVQKIISYEQE